MSENPSRASLLNWLIERFDGRELAPPRSSLEELSDVAERLVRPHLEQRQPLRRAAVAKKLATLSKNLGRAARAATDLGEQGMSHVLLASGESPRVVRAREKRFWERRRPRHLLSGIAKCGCCQGALSAVGRDYLACLNARKRGTCDNRKGIRRARLEELVLSALKHRLMRPDLVKEFVAAFQEEVNRDRRNQESALGVSRRELTGVTSKLEGLVNAIADGLRTPGLLRTLEALETRKAALEREIEAAPPPAPRIHPNVAELYRRKVESLHEALNAKDTKTEAAEILRGLIEAINIRPTNYGLEVELVGNIVNILKLHGKGSSILDHHESSVKVVAGVGFEPTTFRL